MKRTCLPAFLGLSVLLCGSLHTLGDGDNPASLTDVHQLLLQAAGYNADVPPTVEQQTDLLHKALEQIKHIPHVYHGQLRRASQDIEAALDALSSGDPAHQAREDIFDADDQVKALL